MNNNEILLGYKWHNMIAAGELNWLLFESEMRGFGVVEPITTMPSVPMAEFSDGELRYIGPEKFKIVPAYPGAPQWHDRGTLSGQE